MKLLHTIKLFLVLLLGCGSSGNETKNSDSDTDYQRPILSFEARNEIAGRFIIEDPIRYSVWIMEAESGPVEHVSLDKAGVFRIALGSFREQKAYYFFLADQNRILAPFDFGLQTEGIQAQLRYQGGLGFRLADIPLKLALSGSVAISSIPVTDKIFGGFELVEEDFSSINAIKPPKEISELSIAQELVVFDPVSLLEDFFQEPLDPARYQAALSNATRIVIKARGEKGSDVKRVSLFDAGPWREVSRVAEEGAATAPFWADQHYELRKRDPEIFSLRIDPGRSLEEKSVLVFDFERETKSTLTVVRTIEFQYALPLKPKEYQWGEGEWKPFQFPSAKDLADGLLKPLCLEENKALNLKLFLPIDSQKHLILPKEIPVIQVILDYFGEEKSRLVPLIFSASSYPSGFNELKEEEKIDFIETFDPKLASISFRWKKPIELTESSVSVNLWPELFLVKDPQKPLKRIRLRIYSKMQDRNDVSAIALWLRTDC